MTTESAQIRQDIPCRTCGYNLRSLEPTAKCPECGSLVEHSLRGDLLKFAEPDWVSSLAAGMGLMVSGRVVGVLLRLIAMGQFPFRYIYFQAFNDPSQLNGGILVSRAGLVGSILCVAGAWRYTTAEPRQADQEDGVPIRHIIRFYWLVVIVDGVLCQIEYFRANFLIPVVVFDFAANLLAVIGFFVEVGYLQQLVRRIPNLKLAARGNLIKWTMPAILVIWAISAIVRWRIMAYVPAAKPSVPTKLADLTRFVGATYVILWVFFLIWLIALRKQFIAQAKLSRLGS